MKTRWLVACFVTVLACSRSPEDAGIVLNVDAEVSADRALINRIVVTVDGKTQEWSLTQDLPGSLGIKTSPGKKSLSVEGLAGISVRGRWTGVIVANKGAVVVQDVHLLPVTGDPADAGRDLAPARDSGEVGRGADASPTGGASGSGGAGGRIPLPSVDGGGGDGAGSIGIDGGAGGASGMAGDAGGPDGGPGSDVGDAARSFDSADGASPNIDTAPPITAPFTGAFSLISQFEVVATAAAPGSVNDTLGLVHGLVDNPGGAIFVFAEDAGVPGVATLRAALPDVLEGQLSGWMTEYIKNASVAGVKPFDQLVWLDDTVHSLLLYWGMRSRLALPLGTTGTHAPVALVFASPTGAPFSIPVDATASVTAGTGVTAVVSWPDGAAGSAIVDISDHAMGLPFGRYALQALNAILLTERGSPNTAAFLSAVVGCQGMASYVASQCVDLALTTVCVGHESDLLSVCEGGLAEGARQIESQILGLDLKTIHYQKGTSTAVGAQVARPQDATALENGVWSVTVDFGNGPEPANAVFVGVAEPASP